MELAPRSILPVEAIIQLRMAAHRGSKTLPVHRINSVHKIKCL